MYFYYIITYSEVTKHVLIQDLIVTLAAVLWAELLNTREKLQTIE